MTKHYCDRCKKEADWIDLIRIYASRTSENICKCVNSTYEICEECYRELTLSKEDKKE